MLGSALPATATLQTSTSSATPSSPTRPSRLRGLSYLRNYTHSHLHSNSSPRESTPSLSRSRSNNTLLATPGDRGEDSTSRSQRQKEGRRESIQNNENGWLPTVQGRSGLNRDTLDPASTSESASPERSTIGMNRNRASSAGKGPTPASELRSATMRRPSRTGGVTSIDSTMAALPTSQPAAETSSGDSGMPSIRFIPHMDRTNQRPSLSFTAVTRTLTTANSIVRVGRYSERDQTHPSTQWDSTPSAVAPVGFKSKVVSRKHCEFWQANGQWYVKDVKSSSGTFLNHVRLSGPGMESRPFPVTDGDLVQLGIDFKGGEEVIFRCVKIRIEINRGWQKSLNRFNTAAYKNLVNAPAKKKSKARDSDAASTGSSECSICLNPVAPCQALFVSPCSHVWHFKCIRSLINGPNYPNFLCPNCRFSADLEADVEPPEDCEGEGEEFDVEEMMGEEEDERGESEGVGVSDASEEDGDPRAARSGEESFEGGVEGGGDSTGLLQLKREDQDDDDSAEMPVQLPQPGSSKARNIRSPAQQSSTPDLVGARATTPTSNAQFALAAGVIEIPSNSTGSETEGNGRPDTGGPMTPRNDAGPFILDGAGEGSATNTSRALQREVTRVDEDADEEGER